MHRYYNGYIIVRIKTAYFRLDLICFHFEVLERSIQTIRQSNLLDGVRQCEMEK